MILDTNALSAIADGEPHCAAALQQAAVVAVPVIVLGEYRFGIANSRRRLTYERWLIESLRYCKVLEITDETATVYAGIRAELKVAGTPIPSNDAWIAALCRQHLLPLLSRDRHFDFIRGNQRISW